MGQYFITGQAHAGKTHRLVEEVAAEAQTRGLKKALIICTQVATANQMARDIAAAGTPLNDILKASTLRAIDTSDSSRWLSKLWAEFGSGLGIVDNTVRNRTLQTVAGKLKEQLEQQGQNADFLSKAGVLSAISRILSHHGTAEGQKALRGAVAETMGETYALLVSNYQHELHKQGYIERADAARQLAKQEIILDYALGLSGFTSISTEYIVLLRSLAKNNSVGITILFDEKVPASRAGEALISALCLGCGEADVRGHLNRVGSTAPADFAANLFSGKPSWYESFSQQDTVKLSVAQGQSAEFALILSELEEKLSRYNPEEIAIIFRKPNININQLISHIEQRSIPYNLDLKVAFRATAFGAALTNLLDYLSTDKPGKPMSQPLSSSRAYRLGAFLQSGYSGWTPDQYNYNDAQLRSKPHIIVDPVVVLSAKTYQGGANELFNKAVMLASSAIRTAKLKDWTDLIDLMLANALENQKATRLVAMQNSAAHHALSALLSECIIEDADAGQKDNPSNNNATKSGSVKNERIEVSAFLARLTDLTLNLTEGKGSLGRVIITDAERMRSRQAQAIIFAGLSAEGYQKNIAESTDTVISRSLRKADTAEPLLSPTEEHQVEEELFAYLLVSRATKEISFIAQVLNEKGEPLVPSILLDEIQSDQMFSPLRANERDALDLLDIYRQLGVQVCAPAEQAARAMRFGFGARQGLNLDKDNVTTQIGRKRGAEAIEISEGWGRIAGASKNPEREFSPSGLERYVKCPYGWFTSRYLNNSGLDRPIDPMMEGTITHWLIKETYEKWKARFGTMSFEETDLPTIEALVDEVALEYNYELGKMHLDQLALRDLSRIKQCVKNAKNRIRADIRMDLNTNSNLKPTFFEFALGSQGDKTRQEVGAGDEEDQTPAATPGEGTSPRMGERSVLVGGIPIKGRIDRVDLGSRASGGASSTPLVFVFDYKGRIDGINGAELLKTGKIQAAIYLIAAAQIFNAKPIGYAYLSYKTLNEAGAINTDGLEALGKQRKALARHNSAAMTKELLAVEDLVATAAAGIQAGDIYVAENESPTGYKIETDKKDCKYCAYVNCPALMKEREDSE